MERLTPEIVCISTFDGLLTSETEELETRQLDFNLARRSAIVINQVQSSMCLHPAEADGAAYMAQELDLDPDNVDIWGSSPTFEGVDTDTSRLIRHESFISLSNTNAWVVPGGVETLVREWSNYPLTDRPISITNLSHHLGIGKITGLGLSYHAELMIYYFIVELSLNEIGYINASRR